MHELMQLPYEQGSVRMHVDEEGTAWWVAADIGAVLGLKNVRENLSSFPANEKGVSINQTSRGPQTLATVNEPGLYRLVFASRKPTAERFKQWVIHEVLPSIRKTGRYEATASPKRFEGLLDGLPSLVTPPKRRDPLYAPAEPPELVRVSEHLVRLWALFRSSDEWLTNREAAHRCAVNRRTVRHHTAYLVRLGLVEAFWLGPRYRFRLHPEAKEKNPEAWRRLDDMAAFLERQRPMPKLIAGLEE